MIEFPGSVRSADSDGASCTHAEVGQLTRWHCSATGERRLMVCFRVKSGLIAKNRFEQYSRCRKRPTFSRSRNEFLDPHASLMMIKDSRGSLSCSSCSSASTSSGGAI